MFSPAPELLEQRLPAGVSRTFGKFIEDLGRLDLLVIDELGYTPMDGHEANFFSQLAGHLYTRSSLIVTERRSIRWFGQGLRRR